LNWHLVWTPDNLERLLVGDLLRGSPGGFLFTVVMGMIGIFGGTVVGTIVGLMRNSSSRWLSLPAFIFIHSLRNIPLLILIFWLYFITPVFGFPLSKFSSVTIALILFTGSYVAEILRGGILSIPSETLEGARALGLNRFQMNIYVILPHAFYAMIPSLTNRYITAVKNTSLAYLIGFAELTEIGRELNARLYTAPIEIYTTLLLFYFTLNRGVSAVMRSFENRRTFNKWFAIR